MLAPAHGVADKRFTARDNSRRGAFAVNPPRLGAGNSPKGGTTQTGVVKEGDLNSAIAHHI